MVGYRTPRNQTRNGTGTGKIGGGKTLEVWRCTPNLEVIPSCLVVYVYVFGVFFFSILAVRFPDPPVNSLHLGGLKMRDCRIFRFHPFPNLTDTLDSATKSLWCPNVVNDNWHA